jgi:hypothetical protein
MQWWTDPVVSHGFAFGGYCPPNERNSLTEATGGQVVRVWQAYHAGKRSLKIRLAVVEQVLAILGDSATVLPCGSLIVKQRQQRL